MVELITFIIFSASVFGIFFIIVKKVPVLVQLPQNGHHGIKKHKFIITLETRVKEWHSHVFEKQIFLHKILSWTKVSVLKVERKIDALLHGIRKKTQQVDKKPVPARKKK